MPEVVAQQIAASRGSLRTESLLMGIARQYGEAAGRRGALRYALERSGPSPGAKPGADASAPRLDGALEPHFRGSFLVSAVFDAFARIYERRTAALRRIAGVEASSEGRALAADLVQMLAAEAAKTADHVLQACVRALDYLPPVDVHFGDYLRALITADREAVPGDPHEYRAAFAEAFRSCGISPPDCFSMSPDSLVWSKPRFSRGKNLTEECAHQVIADELLPMLKLGADFGRRCADGRPASALNLREESFRIVSHNRAAVAEWLAAPSELDCAANDADRPRRSLRRHSTDSATTRLLRSGANRRR